TTNNAKFEEVQHILGRHGISVVQEKLEVIEPDFDSLEEVAEHKAKQAFAQLQKPVIVDDTGWFFEAYKNFPGVRPKWVFQTLGYEGILKLLEGKSRKIYAKTVCCFTDDGKKFHSFSGELFGKAAEKVLSLEKFNKFYPYNNLFIPDGWDKPLVDISIAEQSKISHRRKAFDKLAEFLLKIEKK
ncbi:MAG: non-canonical purine NTP pyrophosphatase, partial [Candidatus Diapherotrites archaeon]|nr:non-canonical purine NTP pyrophosphatase [Candidatus Diapherotrites archaeon]